MQHFAYGILKYMETNQTLYTNDGTTDLGTQLPNITSSITDMLGPFVLLSFVISVIFLVFYVIAMIRRRKLENALFDIQKNLSEMNARDKARGAKITPTPQPRTGSEKIAIAQSPDETSSAII